MPKWHIIRRSVLAAARGVWHFLAQKKMWSGYCPFAGNMRCLALSSEKVRILLISDQGLDQLVLNMLEMNAIRVEGTRVYVQAGALLSHVAVAAQKAGCAGLAFAHGIPGSLGGAVAMNAGAYGGEMQQVVESVTALFPDGLAHAARRSAALSDNNRHSVFTEEKAQSFSLPRFPCKKGTVRKSVPKWTI